MATRTGVAGIVASIGCSLDVVRAAGGGDAAGAPPDLRSVTPKCGCALPAATGCLDGLDSPGSLIHNQINY
jgi:hypothetical protein